MEKVVSTATSLHVDPAEPSGTSCERAPRAATTYDAPASRQPGRDHLVLGVHHVRDDLGGPLSWDLGFLAFGALLVVAGGLLQRSGARRG